jgi:putative flippase GtrA
MKNIIYKYIKFGFVGLFTYVIKTAGTYFLKEFLGLYYLFSYFLMLIIITIIGFLMSFHVVFRNRTKKIKKLNLYIIAMILSIGIDVVFVKILTDFIGIQYILSITISTFIIFTMKFLTYNFFIFKE